MGQGRYHARPRLLNAKDRARSIPRQDLPTIRMACNPKGLPGWSWSALRDRGDESSVAEATLARDWLLGLVPAVEDEDLDAAPSQHAASSAAAEAYLAVRIRHTLNSLRLARKAAVAGPHLHIATDAPIAGERQGGRRAELPVNPRPLRAPNLVRSMGGASRCVGRGVRRCRRGKGRQQAEGQGRKSHHVSTPGVQVTEGPKQSRLGREADFMGRPLLSVEHARRSSLSRQAASHCTGAADHPGGRA